MVKVLKKLSTAFQVPLLLAVAPLLAGFQNCSGFSPVAVTKSSANSTQAPSTTSTVSATPTPTSTPSSTPAATSTPVLSSAPTATPQPTATPPLSSTPAAISRAATATELVPLIVAMPATASNFVAISLPQGSLYDPKSNSFLWLPQKGQAGNYEADFTFGTGSTLRLTISVASTVATAPNDGFKDGDVGYVFIHGMGTTNTCKNQQALTQYWGTSPSIMARSANNSTLTCYNESLGADAVALSIAQQILNAPCGRFNKCILITHSMGGLIAEHILTHARAAMSSDPEPSLFANAAIYQQVQQRTIGVISLASAAGGSKTADLATDPDEGSDLQAAVAQVADWAGSDSGAVKSLVVARASDILAPINADPGVPIYMVPGYSVKLADSISGWFDNTFDILPLNIFNGSQEYASLDDFVEYSSRSDGLVDFRSSCGIMSDNDNDGPGHDASLDSQMSWCYSASKKANHSVWFLSNMNHGLITAPWSNCQNSSSPCEASEPNAFSSSFLANSNYQGLSAIEVIRAKLDGNRIPQSIVNLSF